MTFVVETVAEPEAIQASATGITNETEETRENEQPASEIVVPVVNGMSSKSFEEVGRWKHYARNTLARPGDSRAELYKPHVAKKLLAVSFVKVGELHFGALKAGWSKARIRTLEHRLQKVVIVLLPAIATATATAARKSRATHRKLTKPGNALREAKNQ